MNESLDIVKQARKQMENYMEFHRQNLHRDNPNYDIEQGQFLAYKKCISILDDLVAERRPAWITDEKIQWSNAGNIYTGYAADLTKLPIGTEFIVQNGGWYGKIVERNGEKLVQIGSDTRLMHPNALVVAIENIKIPEESGPDLQEEQEEER